jgi:uncharacterized protein (DUF362 family)
LSSTIDRRGFVKRIAGLGAAACGARSLVNGDIYAAPIAKVGRDIAVAKEGSPFENTVAAVEALGGMAEFVKPGARVLINPNVSGHLPPDAAVNSHPHVVGALIKLCRDVGAGEVIVGNFNSAKNYKIGKMDEVAEKYGAVLKPLGDKKELFKRMEVPQGKALDHLLVSEDYLAADVLINVPVAKHHTVSRMSLGMKNLMGLVTDRWRVFHREKAKYLDQCIADLASAVKSTLIVVDANKMIVTKGPVGPGEQIEPKKVIAGTDPVAVDVLSAQLLNYGKEDIPLFRLAYEHNLGEIDLKKVNVIERTVGKLS